MADGPRKGRRADAAPPPPAATPVRHAGVVLAIFAVLGPAVGAVAVGLILTIAEPAISEDGASGLLLYAAIVNLPLAYLAGGFQAVATGAATAGYLLHFERPPPWQVPFLVAGACGAVYVVMAGAAAMAVLPFAIVGAHVAAALVCWFLARYLLGWR